MIAMIAVIAMVAGIAMGAGGAGVPGMVCIWIACVELVALTAGLGELYERRVF
jgi:hypothetical protein